MAAPWRRWPTGLVTVLRPLPMRRPLQGATLQRDVLLFEHDRGRFFTILGLFCAGQGVFWASLAVVAVSRHPVPVKPLDAEVPNRGPFDLRSALWRYGLAVGCGTIGKTWAGFPLWQRGVAGHDLPYTGRESWGFPIQEWWAGLTLQKFETLAGRGSSYAGRPEAGGSLGQDLETILANTMKPHLY